LWSFVKIKALFLVCACVMLAGLSARKRSVLVEDWETQSLCCCCDSSGCLLWDLGLYSLLPVVVKGGKVVWTRVRLQQGWLL